MARSLSLAVEHYPIAGHFAISRGSRTVASVIVCTIVEDGIAGRGECVPYARYGESIEQVRDAILSASAAIAGGIGREELRGLMPAGAARNAIDCALWDLELKSGRASAGDATGGPAPQPLLTAYTLSLDTPLAMGRAAAGAAHRPLLKVKLGAEGDVERMAAVREAAPDARLIADANEGWQPRELERNLAAAKASGFELVEQPLAAGADDVLARIERPVPVCADESAHVAADLPALVGRYDAVNIKLDKAGGLTEAIAMRDTAERLGLAVMAGCMLGTSLAMAPAILLAQRARYVDLDGPLLLARDRDEGLQYEGSLVHPPQPALWG